jgi:hypothetical protein
VALSEAINQITEDIMNTILADWWVFYRL